MDREMTEAELKAKIREARAEGKTMVSIGMGARLLLKSNGSMLWQLKYYFEGDEKGLRLGRYPEVPLKLARARRDEALARERRGRRLPR